MRSGQALTDEDRWPWLDRIGAKLAEGLDARRPTVFACSALKRAYRDRLRAAAGPELAFVYLAADPGAMRKRVGGRKNHYMPASLVESQFAALEPPRGRARGDRSLRRGKARRNDLLARRASRRPGSKRGTLTWSTRSRLP